MFDIAKLKELPDKPGVYLMKNERGTVLYVGKAKNLKLRVRQYFAKVGDGRSMIPFLTAKVVDIETIIVFSEKEAFLLENTLIKKYKPKYNILLKDDKTYIALKINTKHKWPMIQVVRYRGRPKADGLYFGPYTGAHAARTTMDLLNKIFPLRQCSDRELISRSRPCILYGMKRCIAPCVNFCTKEEYDLHVNHVIKFLRGKDKEVLAELYREMEEFSSKLLFEKALQVSEMIALIEKTVEKQHVDKPLGNDTDAIGLYRQGDEVSLCQLIFRSGTLSGSRNFKFDHVIQTDEEIILSFLMQHYSDTKEIPHEILVPVFEEDSGKLEEILSENQARTVKIFTPQRGEKVVMLEMATENAKGSFNKNRDQKAVVERVLFEMQEKLKLKRYPERIECFDNSNISGSEPVASMIVFTAGEKDPQRYRKYKIKTAGTSQDDYAAMYEVLSRRYTRAKIENDLPDLVIIDGGKGHLNIAVKVFAELNIASVDIIGLAKEAGRHDKGMTAERVFLPEEKDPVIFPANSGVLFMLQRIRDEAHRTAITFHKNRRSKSVFKNPLDEISGIGPVKKKALLKHFGSFKKIQEASEEEILTVKGINKANVDAIRAYTKDD